MPERVAYFGPAGTFTEEAALRYAPQGELVPCPTIAAVAAAVVAGEAQKGVVPIENSLEGSVTDTLDLLIHQSNLFIQLELVLPIVHCLMVRPAAAQKDIEVIYSHTQALGQCREYLEEHFPRATLVASLSTAAAAEQVRKSDHPTAAAIGTARAAELYGLSVLSRGIQDNPANVTRFVVLAHTDHPPTGDDKTSLCFSFGNDRPGLLYAALGEFARRSINLAKVESRPTKQSLGEYIFLIDLHGHRDDPGIKEAIQMLRAQASVLKIFGSYPRYAASNG
ncbi:MAG: prephenate dehydratase [Dehalococcoidia bacterium]|nr:prephenate dehydratase [Dehalococcoidia bacterium]